MRSFFLTLCAIQSPPEFNIEEAPEIPKITPPTGGAIKRKIVPTTPAVAVTVDTEFTAIS